MIEALKRLLGLDEVSKQARRNAAEIERRERETRVAEQKERLKKVAETDTEQG